jgi:thiosulfate dehydrogenase (quinone) large subunit
MAQGNAKRPPKIRPAPYNDLVPPSRPQPSQAPQAPNTLSSRLWSMVIPVWVILPLRFFLGISFLSAGFDKLTDPTYLDPSAISYIGHQISGFAPGTPLEGFLLNFAVPNASLFGVLVMGGELCIGIAVLLGLLTRFSAAMGLALNLTFFLSATWLVHPFYLGADLPYSFAWLTLLLAGPGPFALDTLVKKWLAPQNITYISKGRTVTVQDTNTAMTRRAFLGAGAAGLTGLVLAATGISWGILNSGKHNTVATVPPATSPTQVPVTVAVSTPVPSDTKQNTQGGGVANPTSQEQPTPAPPTAAPSNNGLQQVAGPNDVPVNQSLDFTLPTGDPAVLVHTDSGYSAYVAICTHQGCQVSYYPQYKIIGCACHGAEFDAANAGKVLRGPARRPLSPVALTIGQDGSVYLAS